MVTFYKKKLNELNTSIYFLTVENALVSLPTKRLSNPMKILISYQHVWWSLVTSTASTYRPSHIPSYKQPRCWNTLRSGPITRPTRRPPRAQTSEGGSTDLWGVQFYTDKFLNTCKKCNWQFSFSFSFQDKYHNSDMEYNYYNCKVLWKMYMFIFCLCLFHMNFIFYFWNLLIFLATK